MSDQEKIKDFFQKRREYYSTVVNMTKALETSYKPSGEPHSEIFQYLTTFIKLIYSEFKEINNLFEIISGSTIQQREIISEIRTGLLYLAKESGKLKNLENMEQKIKFLEAEIKKRNEAIENIENHLEKRKSEMKKQMKEAEEKIKKYAV